MVASKKVRDAALEGLYAAERQISRALDAEGEISRAMFLTSVAIILDGAYRAATGCFGHMGDPCIEREPPCISINEWPDRETFMPSWQNYYDAVLELLNRVPTKIPATQTLIDALKQTLRGLAGYERRADLKALEVARANVCEMFAL
jgi:hypothetical protein